MEMQSKDYMAAGHGVDEDIKGRSRGRWCNTSLFCYFR
jgi:hypothetical protein